MTTWEQAIQAAITSKRIRETHKHNLHEAFKRHMRFLGCQLTDTFDTDPQICYKDLEKRLKYCNEHTKMKNKTIGGVFYNIKRLYFKNEVNITEAQYENLLDNYVGPDDPKENRGYRNDGSEDPDDNEILTMLESGFAGIRDQAIMYLAASSGLREDPMAHATFGHLRQVEVDGVPYPNYWVGPIWSKTRYIIACSSYEFFNKINKYREHRELLGETIYDTPVREDKGQKVDFKKQSPLFRNTVGLRSLKDSINKPDPISGQMIFKALTRIANESGVRRLRDNQEDRCNTQYTVSGVHGFRGFFETACMNYIGEEELKSEVSMRANILKLLMGHKVGIEDYYYDPEHKSSRKRIFQEYLKVQPGLIIYKDKLKLKEKEKENIQLRGLILEDRTKFGDRFNEMQKKQENFLNKAADKLGIDLGED